MTEFNLREELQPIVRGLGVRLVDAKSQVVRGTLHVSLVIFRPGGVGLEECSEVHRTVQPRIELLTGRRDVHMEVTTPGIGRVLKSSQEYQAFVGERIRVLRGDEWVVGVLAACDVDGIELQSETGSERLLFSDVQKARLDDEA